MSKFGNAAAEYLRSHDVADAIITADATGFAHAFSAIVAGRQDGAARIFMPIAEDARSMLLANVWPSLVANVTPDEVYSRLELFAKGALSFSGQEQAIVEKGIYTPAALAYKHCAIAADSVAFSSGFDAAMINALFGYVPLRTQTILFENKLIPKPASFQTSHCIAIWGGNRSANIVHAIAFAVRYGTIFPVEIVDANTPEAQIEKILSSARLIINADSDIAATSALAAYMKPICSCGHGNREYFEEISTFDAWNVPSIIDAVQTQLGRGPALKLADTPKMPIQSGRKATEQPLVSIIITVYDRLKTLERNLELLQRQTYENIEIIVVSNNGPSARKICERFPNVSYIHRETNTGVTGEPRNDGILAAKGAYITALDDDDYFFFNHVERMVECCQNGADVVYSHMLLQIVEPLPEEENRLLGFDIELAEAVTVNTLLVNNAIGYLTVFAKREVYEKLGGYDNVNVYGACEGELWLRMSKNYAFARLDPPSTLYTIRRGWKGSLMSTDYQKFAGGFEKMYAIYPVENRPILARLRELNLETVRSVASPPERVPRYPVP